MKIDVSRIEITVTAQDVRNFLCEVNADRLADEVAVAHANGTLKEWFRTGLANHVPLYKGVNQLIDEDLLALFSATGYVLVEAEVEKLLPEFDPSVTEVIVLYKSTFGTKYPVPTLFNIPKK